MTIDELIAALESASKGDLELSATIDRDIMGGEPHDWPVWFKTVAVDGPPHVSFRPVIHYTASLDAALTLVPKGYNWQIINSTKEMSDGACEPFIHACVYLDKTDNCTIGGTPSLAICIAALRARKAGCQKP